MQGVVIALLIFLIVPFGLLETLICNLDTIIEVMLLSAIVCLIFCPILGMLLSIGNNE